MGLSLILDFEKAGTILQVSSKLFSCMNILHNLKQSHHLPFELCFLAVKNSISHHLLPELHYNSNYIIICRTLTWARKAAHLRRQLRSL